MFTWLWEYGRLFLFDSDRFMRWGQALVASGITVTAGKAEVVAGYLHVGPDAVVLTSTFISGLIAHASPGLLRETTARAAEQRGEDPKP